MHTDPDVPPKWVRWLWEVDASEEVEDWEGGKGLGVGKIVRAGIALADDEGLEGVSVRKLAQRLNVSTMAAYRHISSRDEVIAAMVDVAFGPPPVLSDPSEDWAGGLRCWALAVRSRYDAHPWLLDAPVHGMPTGPHRLRWLEAVLQVLACAGLDLQERLNAALLIDGHVRTVAALKRSLAVGAHDARRYPAANWLLTRLEADGLTTMTQVLKAGALDDGQGYELDYGLDRIIAGIEADSTSGDGRSTERGARVGAAPHLKRGNSSREKTDSTGTSK